MERLRRFLEPHGASLPERAVDTLVCSRALACGPARPGYRELIVPFGAGAYIIRYRIDPRRNVVVITRLWHGRERRT
jgi:hypothetical protein